MALPRWLHAQPRGHSFCVQMEAVPVFLRGCPQGPQVALSRCLMQCWKWQVLGSGQAMLVSSYLPRGTWAGLGVWQHCRNISRTRVSCGQHPALQMRVPRSERAPGQRPLEGLSHSSDLQAGTCSSEAPCGAGATGATAAAQRTRLLPGRGPQSRLTEPGGAPGSFTSERSS